MTKLSDSLLIDTLPLPSGLRGLSADDLQRVASELRDELIDSVSSSGGHFASSLGATELTVALHALFDTPHDRLVWDVGHQAYIHKMLTGRRGEMGSIRKKDGVSGFLKRNESEYDTFGAGHAGTSISAAVGMSLVLQRENPERYTVAIIGDGSLTAGMAFEALNHAGHLGLKNFIVVLNDNEMSISPNVGAISWLFSKAVTSKASTVARSGFKNLYRKGYVPELVYKAIDRAEEAAQGFFAGPAVLFEAFGFRYIGPVDGHNMADLMSAIQNAKQQDVPVLIHCYTQKGKGYEPAEADPIKWHGVNPFDRSKGEFVGAPPAVKPPPAYTAVFADTVIDLAKRDPKIRAITAAMPGGTGLDKFQNALPEQFLDVGICEQHAVTCAAGLACEGYKPICAIYSTFLQRAYDQVVHDVAIQNLPVVFALDRGGVVGNDGETHQGVFDITYLRSLPHLVVMSPKDENELRHMLYTAVHHNGPIAVRYPRGNGLGVALDPEYKALEIGKAEVVERGTDVLMIAFGPLVASAQQVAKRLREQNGLSATIINARFAKPLDTALLAAEMPKYPVVCTIEDHVLAGGFGGAVLEFVNDAGITLQSTVRRFGVGDAFVPHGSQAEQHALNGYDPESIYRELAAQFHAHPLAVAG
jgi:1-deoxy-D-xylulose-5-phosphate synthase